MKISSRDVQKWGFQKLGWGEFLKKRHLTEKNIPYPTWEGMYKIAFSSNGSFEIGTETRKFFLGAAAPRPPQLITLPHPCICVFSLQNS